MANEPPDNESRMGMWFQAYKNLLSYTGESVSLENYFPELDRYIKAIAIPVLNQVGELEYVNEKV